ncbi:MAG: response regulator [Nibricoccus sp.]
MKVLIVENEPLTRLYMEASLATLGLESELAESCEEARSLLTHDGAIRLVVCDWTMPDQSGLELCRWIRKSKVEYVYFIVYLPESSTDGDEDAAIDAGVDDFLQKPVNLRDLRIRLHVARRILDSAAQIRELQALVPICSYCKSVREDEDYWQRIEQYVSARTGSEFTHSVCPECYRKHIIPQFEEMNITPPAYLPVQPRTAKRVS